MFGKVLKGKVGSNNLKIEERNVTSSCSRINKLLGSNYNIEDTF